MQPRHVLALAVPAVLACNAAGEVAPREDDAGLLARVVDPEVRVDRPVIGGMSVTSDSADIAWSGSQYLAVWRHETNTQPYRWVRAARIAADGTVLDRAGIDVSPPGTSSFSYENAAVAPLGSGFVVASGGLLARIGSGGSVQQTIGFQASAGTRVDIASNGGEALIVWADYGGAVRAARYHGDVLDPSFAVGTAHSQATPRVAAVPGGGYLVVWSNTSYNVRGRFISADGAPGSLVTIAAAPEYDLDPDVTYSGSGFAAVWEARSTDQLEGTIRGALVSLAGTVGPMAAISSTMASARQPSISCAALCQVLWSGGPDSSAIDLHGRRLDLDLVPDSDQQVVASGWGAQGPGAIASGDGGHYLAWNDELSGRLEVRGAAATDQPGGLALGAAVLLATGVNDEYAPAIAASSRSWLVAWQDTRNGGYDIFGKRFDLDGVAKTFAAQPIHVEPQLQNTVALGWNGNLHLAAWSNSQSPGALRVSRVSGNGAVLDPDGITVGTGNSVGNAEVAPGAGGWLVAWSRNSSTGDQLMTAIVHDDGSKTTPLNVAPLYFRSTHPAAAYDPVAGVYVVAWFDPDAGLRAARVALDGTLLDTTPVAIAPLADFSRPDMAYGAGTLYLVWEAGAGVRAALLRASGSGIEVLSGPTFLADGHYPTVSFTARGFLVVFGSSENIFGLQVAPNGLVHGTPFTVADGPEIERYPVVAGASQGRALVAYTRGPSVFTSRVYVRRILLSYPDGATCADGAQCESGFCADGRCCDSACGGGADDCQACSVKAGAAVDGQCGVVEAGAVCRASADTFCDLAEKCDGVSIECPLDRGRRAGEICDADCGAVCPLADDSGSPHVCPVCP